VEIFGRTRLAWASMGLEFHRLDAKGVMFPSNSLLRNLGFRLSFCLLFVCFADMPSNLALGGLYVVYSLQITRMQ